MNKHEKQLVNDLEKTITKIKMDKNRTMDDLLVAADATKMIEQLKRK